MKNKVVYNKKARIIYDEEMQVRKKKISNSKIYDYLENKKFDNFVAPIKITSEYEYFPYIEEISIPKEDKAIELMNLISMLHVKTTMYQETNINNIKQVYENTIKEIEELREYYYTLQDVLEYKEYHLPAEQLLLYNISSFYKAINYAEHKIGLWYKEKEKTKNERVVLIHNNPSLEHILYNKDSLVLISWSKSKKDYPVYDFLRLYKQEFKNLEMISLFNIYKSKFQFNNTEKLLFESLISIPPKVILNKTNLINTINVRYAVDYVINTNTFLLEYDKENEQRNNSELK